MPGTSEALLAGLDPEQREVALAARGPVCVLAGAGTGKTRAITYRIAYAALSGTVDPAHVLALTFTVRAAGELRGRLRQLGAGQVRASTFHAAALRQLNYFWPRVVGGRPPQLIDSKAGLVREAARRARVRLEGSPGALADAAAEIEWAKVVQVRPDGYARAAAAAGRSAVRGRGGQPGRGLRRLRGLAAGTAPDRLRVRARADRRHPDRQPGRGGPGARHLQALRRGRVPGREPAAEAAARRVARRPRRPLRGRRPEPGDLLLHRGHLVLPDRVHRGVPRRDRGAAGARLPVHAAGGRGGQPADQVGLAAGRAAPAGAPAGAHRVPRRLRGGGRAGRPGPGAPGGGRAGQGDRDPGPGQRGHRAVRARAGRSRAALRDPRRRALLRTARGPPGAGAAARCGQGRRRRASPAIRCRIRSGTC